MDYAVKLREAKSLIDRGSYTLSVVVLGNILENLYQDFYQEVVSRLNPGQRQVLSQREVEFTAKGDKAAREKGFAGLPLGGKAKFLYDNRVVEEGERLLERSLPQFKAFDPRLFKDIRNEAAHGSEDVVSEDEAELYYRQIRVLLLEVGLIQKVESKPEQAAAGGLHSWKENGVIPHEDILHGNLQMDTYAADLWGVAKNDPRTPAVYRDPVRFFEQTYLTTSLRALLNDVLTVIGGGSGDRVLQLRTPFGGGKTHTLIALYHVTQNRARIEGQLTDLPDPGACTVAAVQCEKFSVRQGRDTEEGFHIHTLWGEIAYQLGGAEGYGYVAEDDQNLTSPGGETIARLIHDLGQPVLILLDEVLNHVETAQSVPIGESTLGRQLMIFLKNLTETVSASRNAALVYSLQASVREGLGAESLLTTLDHLVSRVDAKREPVSGREVMRVVQRRLFKSLGDSAAAAQTAAAYADTYRKLRQAEGGFSTNEQHQAAQDAIRLQERILESYPFHPDLLDLMYHRWGSLPSYQRTRGALQFLASVVHDLWMQGRDLQPLISSGDVLFDQANTRNAFFTQVGERENYSSVMDVDVSGANARAARIDRRIASDSPSLQRYRAGTRLAASVMLYSFGAREGEERGVSELDLLQATCVPGLDRMPLTTALNDLKNELLYLHFTGRRYRFETQPNLNKLIDDETKKFSAEDVGNKILEALRQELNGVKGAIIFPERSDQVDDRVPLLQTIYLPLGWANALDEQLRERELSNWLEFCGNSRREFKNGLVFALPNYISADNLYSAAREGLAADSLLRDKKRFSFHADQVEELTNRSHDSKNRLNSGILSLYYKLAVPVPAKDAPYQWEYIELQSRNEPSLAQRVNGALKDKHRAFDSLEPDKIIHLIKLAEVKYYQTGQMVVGFYAFFNFTRLYTTEAIAEAIAKGVKDKKFGYTSVWDLQGETHQFPNKNLIYFGRSLRPDEIDLQDGLIIEAEIAESLTVVEPPPPPDPPDGGNGGGEPPPPPPAVIKSRVRIAATVDKSKVYKLFRAIQNLLEKSERIEVKIEVMAERNTRFDQVWLGNSVEELLNEADIDYQISLE